MARSMKWLLCKCGDQNVDPEPTPRWACWQAFVIPALGRERDRCLGIHWSASPGHWMGTRPLSQKKQQNYGRRHLRNLSRFSSGFHHVPGNTWTHTHTHTNAYICANTHEHTKENCVYLSSIYNEILSIYILEGMIFKADCHWGPPIALPINWEAKNKKGGEGLCALSSLSQ